MKNTDIKCIDCVEYKRCKDSFASWIFFIIGIIAAIAMRLVIVFVNQDPISAKISWYVGVLGFFLFFVYKFKVNQVRYKLITQRKLVDKMLNKSQLAEEDYNLIGAILCALSSNKERINYFFIFGLSAVALVLAVYFDFIV